MPRPSLDLNVDRVPSVMCARCGRAVDTSKTKPLRSIACPGCGAAVRVPGKIGQFLLTKMLGRGAMGGVFEGVDEELGRRVAIKVLAPSKHTDDAARVEELLTEARALARINHPHVVQIHSVGQHRDQPYIVMELISGGARLEDYSGGRLVLGEREALKHFIAVGEGLSVASKANLVHGDIKPQNILVNAQGLAKVVDFGLAHKVRESGGSTIWGTPYYIAPERARGGACDARGDIFSLAATFWHVLAGRPPYRGRDVREVVAARLKGPWPDLTALRPDLHPATIDLLRRAMAIKPEERHAGYEELIADARAALDALPESPTSTEDPLAQLAATTGNVVRQQSRDKTGSLRAEPPPKPARRPSRSLLVAGGVFVLALVVGGAMLLVRGGDGGENPGSGEPEPGGKVAGDIPFDGTQLPKGWSAAGAALNGKGQLVFTAAPGGAPPTVEAPIGGGDFALTFEFAPLEWNLNLRQSITVSLLDGGDGFIVTVEKDKTGRPVVRTEQVIGGAPRPAWRREMSFDPRSLTLWIGWSESSKRWDVATGIDAARPRLLESLTVASGSSRSRRLTITASAEGSAGAFSAALDRFVLEPGEPRAPSR